MAAVRRKARKYRRRMKPKRSLARRTKKVYRKRGRKLMQSGQHVSWGNRGAYLQDRGTKRSFNPSLIVDPVGMAKRVKTEASGSFTGIRSKRIKRINDPGAYHQWQKYKYVLAGRKLRTGVAGKMGTSDVVQRFQGLREFNDTGFYDGDMLSCDATWASYDSSLNGGCILPVYMFDVRCVGDYTADNSNTAEFTRFSPGLRMVQKNNGSLGWVPINSVDNTGTVRVAAASASGLLANGTVVETSSHNPTFGAFYFHDRAVQKWIDVRMNIWGARSRPTNCKIKLVKMKRDCDPKNYNRNHLYAPDDYGIAMNQNDASYQVSWLQSVKHLIANPLDMQPDVKTELPYKVLKQWEIMIQPTSSTETDVDGHVKTIKIFKKIGQYLNYTKHDDTNIAVTSDEAIRVPGQFTQQTLAENANSPLETLRIIIEFYNGGFAGRIRSSTYDVNMPCLGATAVNAKDFANNPGFDFMCRSKYSLPA